MRRGSAENISQQWSQLPNADERKFHELLCGDTLQKLSVNKLIEQMKNVGSIADFDFSLNKDDICLVQDDVQDFVVKEARTVFKKVLDEPRFATSKKAILNSFLSPNDKEKGLLTRIAENDPTLVEIKQDEPTS